MVLVESNKIAFFCWFFFEFLFLIILALCEIWRNDNILALFLVMNVVESIATSVGRSLSIFLKLINEHAVMIYVGMRGTSFIGLYALSSQWKI